MREAFQAEGVDLSREQWARWFLSEGKRSTEIAQLLDMPFARIENTIENRFERVHQTTGILQHFEAVVTYDDCEHVKPHPQAYLIALQRLGLQADECVAIEDSPRGATAALAAGIRCFVPPTSLTDLTLCPPGCVILENITHLSRHLL